MTRTLRLIANDTARHHREPPLDDAIRDTLAKLDNHRVGVRNLEKALARFGRARADRMGEVMPQQECRLRRDLGR